MANGVDCCGWFLSGNDLVLRDSTKLVRKEMSLGRIVHYSISSRYYDYDMQHICGCARNAYICEYESLASNGKPENGYGRCSSASSL